MSIKLNGETTITVNESTKGIQLGSLSGGNGEYKISVADDWYTQLFETDNVDFQKINGSTLSLSSDWYLDFESKKFVKFPVNHQNGNVIDYSTILFQSTEEDSNGNPTFRITSGETEQVFRIEIIDKLETINISAASPFTQNRYGVVVAQINPTDDYFSEIYFDGPTYFEISGNELKLSDDYFYSEEGTIRNETGSFSLDITNTNDFPDLKFILPGGYTNDTTDADSDGNPDNGFTTLKPDTYLPLFFDSSQILTTPELTLEALPFIERDFGAIIASINYTGSDEISFKLTHTFLEVTENSKLKLKDTFFYEESTGKIQNQFGSMGWSLQNLSEYTNAIELNVSNSLTQKILSTEIIKISETLNNIFSDNNVDGTPQITLTPINFYDKTFGAVIATINYHGQETPKFSMTTPNGGEHAFLEVLAGSNQLKLKDTYFYDQNTDYFSKKNLGSRYKLSDQGTTYNKLNILVTEDGTEKNLASEIVTFSDLTNAVFSSSNILDKDESYTFVSDLKVIDKYENFPKTGREEYQKDIGDYIQLKENEKISYSFLEPGAAYFGSYEELEGLISPSTAFKETARNAFDLISSYANIKFEEISEYNEVVGDFRLGITDEDHFSLPSSYAAYSQELSSGPKGGNIFFNGGIDKNNDGICDFNQSSYLQIHSWNFITFIHEILHSLGLKHPHEVFDSTDFEEGNSNKVSEEYDQYPYTIMSYNPLRDPNTNYSKYDGILLNSGIGGQFYPSSPMLFDVMAIQDMYGINKTNEPEDTIYSFDQGLPPFQSIYDTGGVDTLDLSFLTGGTQLNLEGNEISTIGANYLLPFHDNEGAATTYGTAQPSKFSIIAGTEIEKIYLPSDTSSIISGNYSTYILGKENASINAIVNASEIGIKSQGNADDVITLNQTSTTWGEEYAAHHVGNNGVGSTDEKIKLKNYLKHDLSLDLAQGSDKIVGTSGNDAIFFQNLGTDGNLLYKEENDKSQTSVRIIGVETIDLMEGDDFLDLTSNETSLENHDLNITTGLGNDILWLSDANELVNTGEGDDQVVVNGGKDNLTTGLGKDIITISNSSGELTITDFDTNNDKLKFFVTENQVSTNGNVLTVNNSIGSYNVVLDNITTSIDFTNFSIFL